MVAAMENDSRAEKTLGERQRTDAELQDIIIYHETGELPEEEKRARELVLSRDLFVLEDKVLYRVQPDKTLRIIPPTEDRHRHFEEVHGGVFAGHLRAAKTHSTLGRHYWWPGICHPVVSGVPAVCQSRCW